MYSCIYPDINQPELQMATYTRMYILLLVVVQQFNWILYYAFKKNVSGLGNITRKCSEKSQIY